MHTRRSFLAFAAAAQVLAPVVRALPLRDPRAMAARLPKILLQTHAGRDVYFCNDAMSGRLAVLNLQYAGSSSLCLPPPRTLSGAGTSSSYMYSLTLQPAIGSPADLRRYMEAYATGGTWTVADCTSAQVALVRLRLGLCSGI